MYRLIFETGQRKGQVFDADETSIVDIGRDPTCKLMLEESGVSRRHTIIQQLPDGIYISDLSSTNGTYVNGAKITKETRLKSGDMVEIGAVRFEFQLAPPARPGQPRRRGKLFAVALFAIGMIILIELIALAVIWRSRATDETAEPAVATDVPEGSTAEAPSEASLTNLLEQTQNQLDAKLERAEEIAKEIPEAETQNQAAVAVLGEELKGLRSDIDELREQLAELIARSSAPATPTATPTPPPAPPPAPVDPIRARVEQMVADADRAKMLGEFDEATRILQGAIILVPDSVPAQVALAELYEVRGLTEMARATWQTIVAMGPGIGAAYEEANRHIEEMARKEAARNLPELKPLQKPTLASEPSKQELPRQLRIVDMQKVDQSGDPNVDERWLVRFSVRASTGEKFAATQEVQIQARFYDRFDTGEVVETNAQTTRELEIPAVWESFDRKTFTAQYVAAKGLRKKEVEETGKRRRSYGYIVRVFYRGKLQDEKSSPEKLVAFFPYQAQTSNVP